MNEAEINLFFEKIDFLLSCGKKFDGVVFISADFIFLSPHSARFSVMDELIE
jgi:hypothetical protein